MKAVAILLLSLFHINLAVFPPSNFLMDIFQAFARNYFVIHHHFGVNFHPEAIKDIMTYRRKMVPIMVVDQSSHNKTSLRDEDLHIFIMDKATDVENLNNHLKMRQRFNREFWLVDIGPMGDIDNAKTKLATLHLDFDDDVYLYLFDKDQAKIWEIYKIDPKQEPIIREIGQWKSQVGLDIYNTDKWLRRGNLMGHHFKAAALPSKPYINQMIPVGQNEFQLVGMFADIFNNLAVFPK